MAKAKKITTVNILKAMELGENRALSFTCGSGEGAVEVLVKPRLPLLERQSMVGDIADMVFISNEEGDVTYCPGFKKFAVEYEIINYFTNITLPVDSEKAWEFLEKTGIAARVADVLPDGYVVEIVTDANELIEYRKQELLKRSKFDAVLDNIADVVKAVGAKTEGIELPQILEYVQKNAPELKGEVEQLIKSQTAEEVAAV